MNKLHFPRDDTATLRNRESLMRLLVDLIDHCRRVDFKDDAWVESQKRFLDDGTICEANRYIKKIGRAMGIKFSDCNRSATQSN